MSNTSHKRGRQLFTFLLSGLFIAAAVWIVFNRQYVLDTATNLVYQPSSDVEAIARRVKFSDTGKFTFYATRPEVLQQEDFNEACPRQEQASPILGCYTSNDRIYMYDITSEQLDGIKEVTAAHELLHAVWMRMPQDDRATLEPLLTAAYEANASDSLKSRMEYYSRTEPTEFTNELYAILGTEVPNLGPQLEAEYAKYFERSAVLALFDGYNSTYTRLSNRATELSAMMQALGKQIDENSTVYNQNVTAFSRDVDSFNRRATNNEFASNEQFAAERASLVSRSQQLDNNRSSINADIQTYNAYFEEYQIIGDQLQLLNESMDSYHALEEAPSV